MDLVVGGAFLSASLQVLFDRLASREVVSLFGKRKTNVDGLLKKFKRKLLLVDVVLDDAEVKQFTNKKVRAWSDEARDAVYQADDLLSQIAYEARRREVESDPEYQSSTVPVNNLILSYFTSFDDYIQRKLEEILQLLEDLIREAGSLGLKEGVPRVKMPTNRFSSSVVVATDVYGRDFEKENLIQRLLLDETSGTNKTVDVIPVVGMGGMGKTTLAQLAYNDERVDGSFKKMKAWACVSEEFDVLRVSKKILESFTGCSCNFTDLNQVQECLKGKLKGTKFLIVLDDVWNENYGQWDIFRTPFRSGAPGSKIIVTTRIQNSASILKTGPVINLLELSDDECWPFFAEIAFGESDPSSYPHLEEIGRKIVKRCKGLPLAVKSLAGLLRSKQLDVGEWEDVLKSEFWDLPEDKSDILPALRLSYHHLPSYLKQCFAFCSLFPKNYPFNEKETVSLWIAQKFVSPSKGTSYELEGKKCFRELLSMSFFQQSGHIEDSYFVMHELIHDLALLVSGQFVFRLDGRQQNEIPGKVRHCSYEVSGFRQLQAAKKVNTLWTFLPITISLRHVRWAGLDIEVLSRQKHMRVLSLPRYSKINELLDLVGSLIHLQYLDLSGTDMQQLPESICRLYNLETLLLKGCASLINLPVEIGKLFSLRRLDISETNLTEMPIQTSLLKRLEYLSTFFVGKGSGLPVGGLNALSSLRGELQISGLENVGDKKDALEAKLVEKEHLETLALGWDGVTNDSQYEREVLDYLRPHTNLKGLRIRNYGGTRFPDWLGDHLFNKMVSLRLEDCSNCICLPSLGQLPCLKELSVKGMSCVIEVGQEFLGKFAGGNQPFPLLEALRFEDMLEWVRWRLPGVGEFPKLFKLEIVNCPVLVGTIPENIATLVIERCPSLEASFPSSSLSPSPLSSPSSSSLSRSSSSSSSSLSRSSSSSSSSLSRSSSSSSSPCSIAAAVACSRKLNLQRCGPGVELKWLAMSDLVELLISDFPSLHVLTAELSALTKLEKLKIESCPNILSLSNRGLPPMLKCLEIDDCGLLQSVVDGMVSHNTCSLQILTLSFCPLLVSFADNGLPSTLKKINFSMCPKIELSLLEGTKICPLVVELMLHGCLALNRLTLLKLFPNVQTLRTGGDDNLQFLNGRGCPQGGELENLTFLSISDCKNLKSLPQGISDLLPSLMSIALYRCPEFECLLEAGLLLNLQRLSICDCEKLMSFKSDWGLQRLPSLQSLSIIAGVNNELVESFPKDGLLPSTITALTLSDFRNLKKLNWRGIQQLTSLRYLRINGCPQLESLPDEGLPSSISSLDIYDCPLLTPRCKKDSGDDWAKIAHIPIFLLDGEVISSST